ncbi:hypothetical protein [uncultured Bradyrhizobium sp.]|nr:hypothetical protein [uncultured Bradyrhizobium sp.]
MIVAVIAQIVTMFRRMPGTADGDGAFIQVGPVFAMKSPLPLAGEVGA